MYEIRPPEKESGVKKPAATDGQKNDVAELLDFLRFPLGSADPAHSRKIRPVARGGS